MSVTIRDVMKLMQPLVNRVMMMTARGILTLVKDDAGLQVLQAELLQGEVRDGLERAQQYGFSSHPQAGAEVFVVFSGGNRDHGIVLSCDDRRVRPQGAKAGEVIVYDDQEQWVKLSRDGIDVSAPSGKWIKLQVGNNFIQINEDGIDLVAKRFRQMKAD